METTSTSGKVGRVMLVHREDADFAADVSVAWVSRGQITTEMEDDGFIADDGCPFLSVIIVVIWEGVQIEA